MCCCVLSAATRFVWGYGCDVLQAGRPYSILYSFPSAKRELGSLSYIPSWRRFLLFGMGVGCGYHGVLSGSCLLASLLVGRNVDVSGWWLVFLRCFMDGVPAPVGGSFVWWDLPSPPNSADMVSIDNVQGFLLVSSFKNLSYSKQKIHHIRSPKECCIFKRHLKMVFFWRMI